MYPPPTESTETAVLYRSDVVTRLVFVFFHFSFIHVRVSQRQALFYRARYAPQPLREQVNVKDKVIPRAAHEHAYCVVPTAVIG